MPPQNTLTLLAKMPPHFAHTIDEWMDQDVEKSQKTWSVALSPSECEEIKQHAIQQLQGKIRFLSGSQWIPQNKTLPIVVHNYSGELEELKLPLPARAPKGYRIIRTNSNWQMDYENNTKSMPLEDFYDHLLAEIRRWSETAVFYGVASYAGER